MSKSFKNDLTGQRFGRLTVLEFVPTQDRKSHWLCKCDCGNVVILRKNSLISGNTKSCGCFLKERNRYLHCTHKCSKTRLYITWQGMKSRCYNPNSPEYKNYGSRGISVCDEWKNSFENFRIWALNNGYTDELTIDRIDVNSNYEPANCRWVTQKTQSRNRRTNVIVEYQGKKMCIADVAKLLGICTDTLYRRYRRGDRGDRLFRPVRKIKNK